MEAKFNDLQAALASRCQDFEDTVETLNPNIQQAYGANSEIKVELVVLKDELINFGNNVKDSFETVGRVESNFHGHVGVAFAELVAETKDLQQKVTAF